MLQNYMLPPVVAQQAEVSRLGAPLGVYRPLFSSILAIIGIVVGVIIADILLSMALILFVNRISFYLLYAPVLVVLYGIYAFTIRDLRVYEFAGGLIRVKGQRLAVIRWDQVTAITQQQRNSRYTTALQSFTIRRADGANFKFTTVLRGLGRLHQNVQQAVAQQYLPKAIAAYQSGAPLPFGPLTMSSQGLSNGRIHLLWEEVQHVEIKQGQVIIRKAGKALTWAKINTSQIPNLFIFMSMVQYARTGRTS